MRGDWGDRGGSSRGGGFRRGGQNSGATSQNGAPAGRGAGGARWSDELDAIFERAPKEATAPKNDDEKNFFDERTEAKPATLVCPHCNQSADYPLTWLVRRKREHPSGLLDEPTQARFEKARSYMVRRDDTVACQNVRCHKRFEIAGVQSVAFLEAKATGSVEDRAARVRAAFAGRRGE